MTLPFPLAFTGLVPHHETSFEFSTWTFSLNFLAQRIAFEAHKQRNRQISQLAIAIHALGESPRTPFFSRRIAETRRHRSTFAVSSLPILHHSSTFLPFVLQFMSTPDQISSRRDHMDEDMSPSSLRDVFMGSARWNCGR